MIRNINIDKMGDHDLPDIVYYNLDIINGKDVDEGLNTNPLARFNETRDAPIIKDSSKYYFSIVRFTMDGAETNLPLFIPKIRTGQSNPNLTSYSVSLSVNVLYDFGSGFVSNTFYANEPVLFKPQNQASRQPNPPLEVQDLNTNYYFVNSYQHWVDLVNLAYEGAWSDLNSQFNAWASGLGFGASNLTTRPPFMEYDANTQRFKLYVDNYGFGGASRTSLNTNASESFRMYFNSNMYGLFSSFPHQYQGGDLAQNNIQQRTDFAYEILCEKSKANNNVIDISNNPYLEIDQEWVSTSTLWSPIASLVFISTLIPVVKEQTGAPINYGQGNTLVSIGTQSAFQPIVTDIAIQNTNANSYNEFISYVPTAEYRLSTLSNSPTEIRNIDIQVYWKARLDGRLYPIELFNLSNIQLKIMFRRRDY